MDSDLICNFKKCRKRLNTFGWVTSCSHIFCDDDGTREFNKCYKCPACETNLSSSLDIIRIDLQPTEQYKSMVLAGQKPEVIMEICTRALSFWTYQTHQEKTYLEHQVEKVKDRNTQVEQYYEQIVSQTQAELSYAKRNLESTTKKLNDVSDKLVQKSRQYQKLQGNYESLRRRSVSTTVFEQGDGRQDVPRNFTIPMSSGDAVFQKGPSSGSKSSSRSSSPSQKNFVMRPTNCMLATPDRGIQNKFMLPIGTPNK